MSLDISGAPSHLVVERIARDAREKSHRSRSRGIGDYVYVRTFVRFPRAARRDQREEEREREGEGELSELCPAGSSVSARRSVFCVSVAGCRVTSDVTDGVYHVRDTAAHLHRVALRAISEDALILTPSRDDASRYASPYPNRS